MILNIETPSILFPAITLLLLAYTNRFLALSQLIRSLHRDYQSIKTIETLSQIKHLRYRVVLIQLMQALGVFSLILCTFSIFSLLLKYNNLGLYLFVISLCVFSISIICSLIEILMSSRALNILLSDIKIDSKE